MIGRSLSATVVSLAGLTRVHRTALLLLAAEPASAQVRFDPPLSRPFALFRPAPTPPPARPASFIHSGAPDYRWEGLVIGAVALGALGVYAGNHFCGLSDSAEKHCLRTAVSLGLLGAFGGGIIGGLIGGSMPKVPPKVPPDSVR